MTSTFTPKAQGDTVQQTNKRSFSQVSANDQVSNQNTNNVSFDLNVQNLMPLIDHLKQENEQLRHQRDQIQSQMTKIKSLSEQVFEQNNLMKQHYQQRTQDVRKIVTTMSINMNEEIEDVNHMIHMTKNHNFAIVKNIEMTKKQIQQKDNEIQTIQNELAQLAARNTLLEEEMITRNVKIRQMQQKLQEIKSHKTKQDNLFKLEEEVERLVQQVQALRLINTKKLKNTQTLETRNQLEKPQYKAENLSIVQTIKALQHEIDQLRQDSASFDKNLQNLKGYHKKVTQKCQKANQQRQHQTLEIDGQQNEMKIKKQNIFNNKNCRRQKQIKKSQLEDEKYQLERQLALKKDKINKLKSEQYREREGRKRQLKQKLSRQRTEHKVEVEKSYDDLKFRLRPQKEKKQQILEEQKKEYQELEGEAEEMKRTIKNMDNPVKEIIRLQYQVKKLNV